MPLKDEFQQFRDFVREHKVKKRGCPVLYDLDEQTYVAHTKHLSNPNFKPVFTINMIVDGEVYLLVEKISGFRPKVVEK